MLASPHINRGEGHQTGGGMVGGSHDSTLRASQLDLSRALAALDRGWITPDRFRAIARCDPRDNTQMERLRQEGILSASQLAELYGSTVLLAPKATLQRLGEAAAALGENREPLQEGDWIGARYRILDILQGGFGRIYICEARMEERYDRGDSRVALKTPLRKRLADPSSLVAFHVEAAQWIQLGAHPNIVLAYGVEEYQRLPFLVMEYIEGARGLDQEIQAGRMNWARGLWVAVDVARGLAFAERQLGLVHGDLKPLNLLVTPAGAIKITDFGLSLCGAAVTEQDNNILAGTLGYLAPEMYQERPQRTTRTDMYAFGVTLFEAITGQHPFSNEEPWLNRMMDSPDPRRLDPSLPGPFADLILACLHRDPEARPASFQELVPELERLHHQLLGTALPPSAAPDAPSRADALANLSGSWLNLDQMAEAEAAARKALDVAPDHWKAHCALGNARLRQGDAAGALRSYEAAHGYGPDEIAPLLNAALAAQEAGQGDAVAAWLDKAFHRCQAMGRYSALDAVSSLVVERMPVEEALQLLDRIVVEDPCAVMTWNNRAALLRRSGRHLDALDSAERALAINPIYAKGWSNRATILAELGRFQEAVACSIRALELDPALAGAYAAKATALAQLDRLEEARAAIREGLRILPDHPLLQRAEGLFGA